MTRPYGEDMETMSIYTGRPGLEEHQLLIKRFGEARTALHATFGSNSVSAITAAFDAFREAYDDLFDGVGERIDASDDRDAAIIVQGCDEQAETLVPLYKHAEHVKSVIATREAFDRDLAAIRSLPETYTPAHRTTPHRGSTTRPARRRKPLASAKSPPRLPEADDPRPRSCRLDRDV